MGNILDKSLLIHLLVFVVAPNQQRIYQTHRLNQLCGNVESLYLLADDLLEKETKGVVGGGNHLMHLLDDAVHSTDITIADVDGRAIDPDAVRIIAIVHHQLALIHVRQAELCIVLDRERPRLVWVVIVATIDDAVVDNHLADGIQRDAVAEPVPRGSIDDTLRIKTVQIDLDGFIGGSKHAVVPTG